MIIQLKVVVSLLCRPAGCPCLALTTYSPEANGQCKASLGVLFPDSHHSMSCPFRMCSSMVLTYGSSPGTTSINLQLRSGSYSLRILAGWFWPSPTWVLHIYAFVATFSQWNRTPLKTGCRFLSVKSRSWHIVDTQYKSVGDRVSSVLLDRQRLLSLQFAKCESGTQMLTVERTM